MSSLVKKPVSIVVFDRTRLYGSDVPVFSSALRQKVTTPTVRTLDEELSGSTQAILQKITQKPITTISAPKLEQQQEKKQEEVLRADSFGGQTNEFAQSAFIPPSQHSTVSVQQDAQAREEEKNTKRTAPPSDLFESPELVRFYSQTTSLMTHLFPAGVNSVVIPRVTIPKTETFFLQATHAAGLIDICVIPESSSRFSSLMQFETVLFLLRKGIQQGRRKLARTPQYWQTLQEKLQITIQAYQRKVTLIALPTLPTLALTTFRFPSLKVHRLRNGVLRIESLLLQARERLRMAQVLSKLMIAGSLVLLLLTLGPMVALEANSWKEQVSYSISTMISKAFESQFPTSAESILATPTPSPTPNPDPEKQFQIQIPKIGVNSKVIANVDAGNEKIYDEALKRGVAHAAGTGLPGESNSGNKTIFLFGHSTNGAWNVARYNALFYSLKDLKAQDSITMWFWGKKFDYTVTETKIVAANDVSFLQPQTTTDQLILQTCWPPGTSWKRLLVIAEPIVK